MSWSIQTTTTQSAAGLDLFGAVDKTDDSNLQNGTARAQAEEVAYATAYLLQRPGILDNLHAADDEGTELAVTMSGHTYTGPGSAMDSIAINITRIATVIEGVPGIHTDPEQAAAANQEPALPTETPTPPTDTEQIVETTPLS